MAQVANLAGYWIEADRLEPIDDWQRGTATSSLSLKFEASQFEQPEGVVRSRDERLLYVVGEKPGDGRVVFGLWSFEP